MLHLTTKRTERKNRHLANLSPSLISVSQQNRWCLQGRFSGGQGGERCAGLGARTLQAQPVPALAPGSLSWLSERLQSSSCRSVPARSAAGAAMFAARFVACS